MTSITLFSFTHKNISCTEIRFPYNFSVKEYVKKWSTVRWTQTHRCFYILNNTNDTDDFIAFKKYIEAGGFRVVDATTVATNQTISSLPKLRSHLTEENEKVYADFMKYLRGRRYSESTVMSYGKFVFNFLIFTGEKPLASITENDVRLFMEWSMSTYTYAVSTHRQMVSGLKHFAHFYPVSAINVEAIYMPKKDKKLPTILSIQEILKLMQVTKNLKHRTIIAMLYGSGLRIGELITLTLSDFDFRRNELHIRNAKGRKDRYVTIAKSLYPLLKNYHATYKPTLYFIENPMGGMYSATSIRSFLKKSCKAAGIKKRVTPHSLRHSYATHLLEQGTDLRYIQELLGHSRPETTMVYTQVTQKSLREIKSPLDTSINQLYLRDNDDKNILIT